MGTEMKNKQEIEILRFFEMQPLDKVELLFNIVSEKIRERRHAEGRDRAELRTGRRSRRSQETTATQDQQNQL
jgi:hypothetical protein